MEGFRKARDLCLAVRPWSFTVSTMPVLAVALALHAHAAEGANGGPLLLLTGQLLAAILTLHSGANLLNTYCDWAAGTDTAEHADDRTLVDRLVDPGTLLALAAALLVAPNTAASQ